MMGRLLRADAITASCTANANGATSGTVSLVNAKITDPTGAVTLLALPANPTPNTPLGVPGILDIVLNEQSSASPGQLSVTALHLTLLGGLNSGTQVRLGTVTCGPNARTAPVPLMTSGGLPVAGGARLVGATVLWFLHRRRSSTRCHA